MIILNFDKLSTKFNLENPYEFVYDGEDSSMFIASSPKEFCTNGREEDLDALVNVMNEAEKTISVSVMDYSPTSFYSHPNYYFPYIDDAIRDAAFRKVHVKLMFSYWPHTKNSTFQYLESLNILKNVEVKLYVVPENSEPIPFTRVNHSKYMVNEKTAYIGTSNWSGDYFDNTGGVSVLLTNSKVVKNLQEIFDTDWNSKYCHPLKEIIGQ
eukprot:TRINITY_DN2026_c0_g1_i1.p2 TRINITY_DN2026_c0_g1~~TRINITY_DN2026_c0_g1_i1.p2  ORF type:complete len:211 (+),score=43.57 TRINITY_DN2026_c0_g1_i1:649-1281(+)